MLKHISPAQLRLGMYIHALDGSWLNHGFWKNSFMLKTEADLQRLQTSGIASLWIDVARGLGVCLIGKQAADPPSGLLL